MVFPVDALTETRIGLRREADTLLRKVRSLVRDSWFPTLYGYSDRRAGHIYYLRIAIRGDEDEVSEGLLLVPAKESGMSTSVMLSSTGRRATLSDPVIQPGEENGGLTFSPVVEFPDETLEELDDIDGSPLSITLNANERLTDDVFAYPEIYSRSFGQDGAFRVEALSLTDITVEEKLADPHNPDPLDLVANGYIDTFGQFNILLDIARAGKDIPEYSGLAYPYFSGLRLAAELVRKAAKSLDIVHEGGPGGAGGGGGAGGHGN